MAIKFTQVVDFANQRQTSVGSPSVGTDGVNKDYVDNAIQGLSWKESVRAASTGNLTLTAPGATIDGVSMATNDRFLAKNQTAGAENGIYVWTGAATAATRAADADSDADFVGGLAVTVEEGTVNGDKVYMLTTNAVVTVGTTALVFSVLGGGTSYLAGNGLTLTGSTFSVVAGTGISVGSGVAIDTAVVARKYATNVGDGSSTSLTVTHNLGTRDVEVEVYTNGTPWDTVYCEVQRPDTNTVTLIFAAAPASAAYRAVVQG